MHQARIPAATAMATTPQVTGPPMNDQLRSQLIALNVGHQNSGGSPGTTGAEDCGNCRDLASEIGCRRIQTQFAAMNADYEEMQKNYNALLEKQQEAAMTTALNQREQAHQFVVGAGPPNLPVVRFVRIGDFANGRVLVGLLIGI